MNARVDGLERETMPRRCEPWTRYIGLFEPTAHGRAANIRAIHSPRVLWRDPEKR